MQWTELVALTRLTQDTKRKTLLRTQVNYRLIKLGFFMPYCEERHQTHLLAI